MFFIPQLLFSLADIKAIKSPADLDSIVYDINSPKALSRELHFPFSKIEIIDSRFDTSKLGFTFNVKSKELAYTDYKKIKLSNGVAKNMQEFYQNHYKACFNNSEDKLLIVLKNLWISNLAVSLQSEREYDQENPSLQDVYAKFEFYLCRGQDYYALTRIDTLYQLRDENIKAEGSGLKLNDLSFFTCAIKELIEKPDYNNLLVKIADKRKFSISEINAFNEKRFSLPILTTEKYNQCVFLSSDEFINNAPSIKDFKINRKGELSDYGNKKERLKASWAFADRNGLHFKSAKEPEIFRTGNTFEFFREEVIYVSRTIAGSFIDIFSFIPTPGLYGPPINSSSQTRQKVIIVPRQLNMETGEVY